MIRLYHISFCILIFAIALTSAGCRNIGNQIAITNNFPVSAPEREVMLPQDTSHVLFMGLKQKCSVVEFYHANGGEPIWFKKGRFLSCADSMLFLIGHAQYYGFTPTNYHLVELEKSRKNASVALRTEVLLTDAFLALSGDLKFGLRKSRQKESEDSLRRALLANVVLHGNLMQILEAQEPAFIGYKQLKEGLRIMLDSVADNTDSVSRSQKIRLIAINMERWRRESVVFKNRYIFINIPSFMLEVVVQDSIVLSSKVIVGTPEKKTPVLSSIVECLSIYPYWHVPKTISIEEYLPVLKMDTSFLRRNNFQVLDRKGNILNADSVKWNKFNENYFPVVLRQREGTENSLGVIKFIFDNPYSVFLHDTNSKRLFSKATRAFSHGCIRMEKAVELAHYLVTGFVGIESKAVSKYLKEKQQRWMDVKNPIPIYTRYFTTEFKNGVLYFYKDIYNKDQELIELLYGSPTHLEL